VYPSFNGLARSTNTLMNTGSNDRFPKTPSLPGDRWAYTRRVITGLAWSRTVWTCLTEADPDRPPDTLRHTW
jgi:hypothetical protein